MIGVMSLLCLYRFSWNSTIVKRLTRQNSLQSKKRKFKRLVKVQRLSGRTDLGRENLFALWNDFLEKITETFLLVHRTLDFDYF